MRHSLFWIALHIALDSHICRKMSDKNADENTAILGYEQTLYRGITQFANFGISFSIISVTTGISTLFYYGLNSGGPAGMIWSGVIVCIFSLIISLSLAEICRYFSFSLFDCTAIP